MRVARSVASSRSESRAASRPVIDTTPELGRSSVPITCSSVVLPEPEGPTIATSSPSAHREADLPQRVHRRLGAVDLADSAQLQHRRRLAAVRVRDACWPLAHDVAGTTTRWPADSPWPLTCTRPSASSNRPTADGHETVHVAFGDLHRVAAAGEREQRVDRHRQHVFDAFGGDLDVHGRLVQVARRRRIGGGGVDFDRGRAFFFAAAAGQSWTASGDAGDVGDPPRRGLVVRQRDRDRVADLDAGLLGPRRARA